MATSLEVLADVLAAHRFNGDDQGFFCECLGWSSMRLRTAGLEHEAHLATALMAALEPVEAPVTAGDARDGRGHGRDDESGRGAGL